jgi:histidinol-phosphatase (PHP family)
MGVASVPEYVELCAEAKQIAPFPLRWGFECEWYPAYESWYRDYLRAEVGAEYLVYGSHWINDNGDFWYIPDYPEKRILRQYVDLTIQGLRTGFYDLFAHPDIFLAGFPVMDDELKSASADIIACAVEIDIPMEINGFGLHKEKVPGPDGPRSPYPVREFWEMASRAGARIVCCSDAHRPHDVIASTRNAMAFAERIGIVPLDAGEALLVR